MTRNSETLASEANPSQRFWQALRNWSGRGFVFVSDDKPTGVGLDDTFYWEGRAHDRT